MDAGLTFNKKDLEHSFIFDIKTIDRVFYLVADTEEEMNKWVRCICDICGFNPTDDGKDEHFTVSYMSIVPPINMASICPGKPFLHKFVNRLPSLSQIYQEIYFELCF